MAAVQKYEPTWLADFLHSFPHIDLSFQTVDSKFDPDNPHYRESLLFWGAIPVLWLLLTLLVFLMYFCYRCCQKDAEKKKGGGCLPWTMAILAVLACGVIGVGYYGNEQAHRGLKQFSSSGDDMKTTISAMEDTIIGIQDVINNTVQDELRTMRQTFGRHVDLNATGKEILQKIVSDAEGSAKGVLNSINSIKRQAHRSHIKENEFLKEEYGYWRWVGTMLLLLWQILLFLLLLAGIGKQSKCTLLMFCAFGIFTLVLAWVAAGLHLGVSVGLGDLCSDPDPWFEKMSQELMNSMDEKVVKYYVKCSPDTPNPFSSNLHDAMSYVGKANTSIYHALNITKTLVHDDVKDFAKQASQGLRTSMLQLQQLTALVECTNIHKDYREAVKGVCYHILPGIVFILLCATVVGLLLTILVLLASCAWKMFGRSSAHHQKDNTDHVKGYHEIDEDEPFFPRAQDTTSPTYYSFPRGRSSNPRSHVPMHRRSSPPPAYATPTAPLMHGAPPYSTNEFYRQYNELNQDSHQPMRHAESIA